MKNIKVYWYNKKDNINKGNSRIYERIKNFSFQTTPTIKKYIFPHDLNESKNKTCVNFFQSSLSPSTKEKNENFQEIKNFTIIHQKHYW